MCCFFFSELKHPPPPPEKKKEIIYVALSVQALIKGFSGKNDSYLKQLEEFFFLLLLNPLCCSHEIAE